ncbi:hypothetical protein ACWCPQ_13910 [Nocardia sp. NPDC001965]
MLHIAPVTVPVSAVCWAALMVGAVITHGASGNTRSSP